MKIILKHILRNIKEKKARSLLIILSLVVATMVFVLNLTLPDEIIVKIQETLRSVHGKTEVAIYSTGEFNIKDVKLGNEKITYTGSKSIIGISENKQILIYGFDIDNAKNFNLLGEDVCNLSDNEVVVGKKIAEKYDYKEGQELNLNINEKQYIFKIAKIVENKGFASIDVKFPFIITNLSSINKITESEEETVDYIYVDVENDENVQKFVEYVKENNKDFMVKELVNISTIKDEISFVTYILLVIFAISAIMIMFVVSTLNNLILAERMPVIGTFRSIGASKHKMNAILILENSIYGLIAGTIGSFLGYIINGKVASAFITTSGVELSKESASMKIGTLLLGIAFAILLEIIITLNSIRKNRKKSIKDVIFNVQSTKYEISKKKTILGLILFVTAFIVNTLNKKSNLIAGLISITFVLVGISFMLPIIIRVLSTIFSNIFRKIRMPAFMIASKNIGNSKMIISSSILLVVAVSSIIVILTASSTFSKVYEAFKYIYDFDLMVENISKSAEEYEKIKEIEGVEKIDFSFWTYDSETSLNDGKKFSMVPAIVGSENGHTGIQELNYKTEDLKENEILIDEKLAEKSNIKISDIITIKFGTYNKEDTFKVVGFVNSAYFTTNRNVVIMKLNKYKGLFGNTPAWIEVKAKEGTDIEKLKVDITNKINEINVEVETFEEYIDKQEEQNNGIMSIFYVIIGLAVALSFIGIINNQIISFMQRKREIAVLNSTCMNRAQIRKMLIAETIMYTLISCIISLEIGYLSTGILDVILKGMSIYVEMVYDWNKVFKFMGIVFILNLLTTIIPIKRLRKVNIVEEIKYE